MENLCESVEILYNKGYCAIDIVDLKKQNNKNLNINDLLLNFKKIKREFSKMRFFIDVFNYFF